MCLFGSKRIGPACFKWQAGPQTADKTPCGIFVGNFAPPAYSPTARRAAGSVRNALLRKASETAAHVAGFG